MFPTDHLVAADPIPGVIPTPLGTVEFSVVVGEDVLPAVPNQLWALAGGAHLYRWIHRGATVDLLLGSVAATPWDGDEAVPTWAAVWQVSAGSDVPDLVVSAEIVGLPADAAAGPDAGECLAAVSAESDEVLVSIGGPDTELLWLQAEDGRLLPGDWVEVLPSDASEISEYGVRYEDPAGIAWHLPGLAAGEAVRLCIGTAWSPRDDDHPAAWYAVDLPLDTAFSQLIADPA
ncbi:hypothetical protein [Nocardia stercoris]|uniref:Uncharacterized protein n=1 Tax=Nocardia stercoris TaxID=2483361 RepID=A0A3M2LBN4_9NOCA|nr:hypothetical protein [Nocardia stercoris]RMI34949.1 hypothetical protein EBN03_00885 [Nocardia stercoris]